MARPQVKVLGRKYQIVVGNTVLLETESQGEIEEKLKELRRKPKPIGQTLPQAVEIKDVIQETFDTIESHFASYLTDWEENFILETQEWYTEKHMLTTLQKLKLDDILARCVKRANPSV